jgi:hypothetical protein
MEALQNNLLQTTVEIATLRAGMEQAVNTTRSDVAILRSSQVELNTMFTKLMSYMLSGVEQTPMLMFPTAPNLLVNAPSAPTPPAPSSNPAAAFLPEKDHFPSYSSPHRAVDMDVTPQPPISE